MRSRVRTQDLSDTHSPIPHFCFAEKESGHRGVQESVEISRDGAAVAEESDQECGAGRGGRYLRSEWGVSRPASRAAAREHTSARRGPPGDACGGAKPRRATGGTCACLQVAVHAAALSSRTTRPASCGAQRLRARTYSASCITGRPLRLH